MLSLRGVLAGELFLVTGGSFTDPVGVGGRFLDPVGGCGWFCTNLFGNVCWLFSCSL